MVSTVKDQLQCFEGYTMMRWRLYSDVVESIQCYGGGYTMMWWWLSVMRWKLNMIWSIQYCGGDYTVMWWRVKSYVFEVIQ